MPPPVRGLPIKNDEIGPLAVTGDIGTLYSGTEQLTVKRAFANIAASQTDSELVAAVTGKKILVLVARLHTGSTATNVTLNTASTAISEMFATAANGGHHLGYCPIGHFETDSGEALTVTTGSGSTVGIGVVYVEV